MDHPNSYPYLPNCHWDPGFLVDQTPISGAKFVFHPTSITTHPSKRILEAIYQAFID